MATDEPEYVTAKPSGRALTDLSNPKREPGVPFDPTSPAGKHHTQTVFSTGTRYKCRVFDDASLAALRKPVQWKTLYSTLRTCIDGDLSVGRRADHFKGFKKMSRIADENPSSLSETQRKALLRMRHEAFSRKRFFNVTIDSLLRQLDAWLEGLRPEDVEPGQEVGVVREAYRAHVAADVALLAELQAQANADAQNLTDLLVYYGLDASEGTRLDFTVSGGRRHLLF